MKLRSRRQDKALLAALLCATLAACHTPGAEPERELVTAASKPAAPEGGYFVTLAAKPTSETAQKLYDRLYDALDVAGRKRAIAAKELDSYVEEFDQSGYTHLADGDEEIECDREKCLFKLTSRALGDGDFTRRLYDALSGANADASTRRDGEAFLRTLTLGEPKGPRVACTERRRGPEALAYDCKFELDGLKGDAVATSATIDTRAKGRLFSCVLSPGVVKTAEEAKADLDGGGLLKLTASPGEGAKAVGYLRYAARGGTVELVDLYLCGDFSQDYFWLTGEGKDPRQWAKPGMRATAHHDDADLELEIVAAKDGTLEVRFKLVKEGADLEDVYGEDRFFLHLDKSWL